MMLEEVYNTYLSHLIDGDKATCHQIVKDLLATGIEIKDLYTNLFQRSLYQIGELWEFNRISVAVEHIATAITENLLILIYPTIFASEHIGKKAIIACVANEFHQVGAKMVADIFELNRWDGYFVGSNTPTNDLMQLIDEKKPDILGLSLSIYFNMTSLLQVIEKVRTPYPQLDIFVGGQAFRWGGTDIVNKYPNVTYIPSLQKLETTIAGA